MAGTLSHRDEDAAVREDRRGDDGAAQRTPGQGTSARQSDRRRSARAHDPTPPRRTQPAIARRRAPGRARRRGPPPGSTTARGTRARPRRWRARPRRPSACHGDQARGARRRDARVAFVPPVGGGDHQQIAHGQHLAVGGLVREDAQAAADVELPDDVGRACVETSELAFGGHVVQPVAFHVWRARRRRQQPLPQASLDSWGRVLPRKRPSFAPNARSTPASSWRAGFRRRALSVPT